MARRDAVALERDAVALERGQRLGGGAGWTSTGIWPKVHAVQVSSSLESVTRTLAATPGLEVAVIGTRVFVGRRRALPRRGLFRLLIPRATAIVTQGPDGPRASVRPDGLALFMVVMLIGGVAVEILMDRRRYPREYPPAFVYTLAALYTAALIVEIVRTAAAVRAVLGGKDDAGK